MCGITGYISSTKVDKAIIESMTTALSHRGPDANNIYIDPSGVIALGHTRLSIIDLNTEANQPFHSSEGRYTIVFNGEIYNFQSLRNELQTNHGVRFRTNSDTEVALQSFAIWGSKMADKLDGMFAIVILDKKLQTLSIFRDRIGKKPLYYFQSESLFAFASEIKSLLKHPVILQEKKINRNIISTFLHLGYIPEPHTIYANIRKFPAGHVAEVNVNLKIETRPYWCIKSKINISGDKSETQVKNEFHELLTEAVRKRLISDVPLGTFLSGGTDSSLITAIAAQQLSNPIKTFSIGFQESKFDESYYSNAVAKHLGTDHTQYMLTEKEAFDLLDTYVNHFDEPFADTSAIPTMLVSKLARKDVKVVLTGDGGDELFQGYGSYTWANRLEYFPSRLMGLPIKLLLQRSKNKTWKRAAQMFEPVKYGSIRSHIFSQEQYLFTQQEVTDKLLKYDLAFKGFEYSESFLPKKILSAGEKQALFDLQFYLKDDLLVKVDRASMFHALECRCPLLDHHVIEYALSLNNPFKKRKEKNKWLLKELLKNYIPNELVDRPKWGFSVPLANWLKGDLRHLIEYFLSKEITEDVGLFNFEYIHNVKNQFFNGRDYLYNRLWVIIVLHKWWKENM